MGAQYDRKLLGQIKHAVTRRFPLTDEVRKDAVEIVHNLLKNGSEERTQLKAAQVIVAMDHVNLKEEIRQDESTQQAGPTVHITNNLVTVDPNAFTAFLDDVRQATMPKPTVIDGTVEPLPNGLKELPAAQVPGQSTSDAQTAAQTPGQPPLASLPSDPPPQA